jgi:hypothetical protein
LVDELKKTEPVLGVDTRDGLRTNFVINGCNMASYMGWIKETALQYSEVSIRVIIAIAPSQRSKDSLDMSAHLADLKDFGMAESELLLTTAKALSENRSSLSVENHVVVIGSPLSGSVAISDSPVYASSKSATKTLVKYLAAALGPQKVNVNMVTPALLANDQAVLEVIRENLKPLGLSIDVTPYNEVLKAIRFVSSDMTSLRGSEILLDYGLSDLSSYWTLARSLGNI